MHWASFSLSPWIEAECLNPFAWFCCLTSDTFTQSLSAGMHCFSFFMSYWMEAECLTMFAWFFCLTPSTFTQSSSAMMPWASFSLSPWMETEDGYMGGSLHLLLDMLVVCWVEAAVEMSRDGYSHSSSSFQAVSTILVVCLTLLETLLVSMKAFDTGGLTFSVSYMNFSLSVGLEASAISVRLTLGSGMVFQVQGGRPSRSNSLKKSTLV